MVRTAYLRVYQPLSAFPAGERAGLLEPPEEDDAKEQLASRRWLLHHALPPNGDEAPREGAFMRELDGETLICPWRTRLRMLAGLLAFRGSVPDEVADAFVPEGEAHEAARELAELEANQPEVRSHIIHANWHVPLRWFAAFDDSERILTEDRRGLRVRYEARLSDAHARLTRAIEVLESSWIDEGVTSAVKELRAWLGEFTEEGVLELDYGSVAGIFPDEVLVEDRSAGEVQGCLEALEGGDVVRAGEVFAALTDRWTEVRAREVVN
ncbi:MAG: hypothetical protein ACR2KQ_08530 [Actinomycetota bacterium]